jgi:hypothetical protein
VTATSFGVILLAELGDLSDIVIANLAARYHDPVPVAIGSVLALWAVVALAIVGGRGCSGSCRYAGSPARPRWRWSSWPGLPWPKRCGEARPA